MAQEELNPISGKTEEFETEFPASQLHWSLCGEPWAGRDSATFILTTNAGRVEEYRYGPVTFSGPFAYLQMALHYLGMNITKEVADARTAEHGRGQVAFKLAGGYLAASDLRSDGQAVGF